MLSELDNSQNELPKNDEQQKNNEKINLEKLLNTKTSNTLYDLYPPEKIDLVELKREPTNKKKLNTINKKKFFKKDKNKTIRLSRSFTLLSKKTKESYIPQLMIDEKEDPSTFCKDDAFGVAITGPTFERLYFLNEHYTKKKDILFQKAHDAFRLVIKNGRVFARMAPEHKALLVEALKNEGFTTLMCGDGTNDCSALRTAHVGVSLSAEEASIAANFTCKIADVSCVYELLREGKCSLTTSIQTFKYMMLYAMIQFISATILMIYSSYLTNFQFLVTDLFITFPLEWFLAMTKPYSELTHHYPISDLISFPILTSIITHFVIVFAFQFGGFRILKNHYGWKNICDFDDKNMPLPCHENTIFF